MHLAVLFKTILSLSFMGSITAIIILLVKRLLNNRLSPSWHYYIWFLLVLRLLIPYSFESSISLLNPTHFESGNTKYSQNKTDIFDINTQAIPSDNVIINKSSSNYIQSAKENMKLPKKGFELINYGNMSIIWIAGSILVLLYTLSNTSNSSSH